MTTTLELLHTNVCADRYDYKHDWASKRRTHWLDEALRIGPDLITLTECQQPAADDLAYRLTEAGMKMRALSYLGSSILYDPDTLVFTRELLGYALLGGSQTHSLFGAEFGIRVPGYKRFNLLAAHLPPFATRAALRRRQMSTITAKTCKWQDPTVLAMDANWSKTLESFVKGQGWQSARLTATDAAHRDYRTSGGKFGAGNPIDYVIARNRVKFSGYEVIDGRRWCDHNGLLVTVKL